VLDAGDYSMGTAFGAATRETGGELQLMSHMGYDATTFGNHDFDFGPAGLGKSIGVAAKAGRFPPVVASNTNFAGTDATLADLQRLAKNGVIRRHVVIERGGIRFGIFGVLGKEAQFYTTGAGAVTFYDANETAKEMAATLRETEKVDVVICLSHGGVEKAADGRFSAGDDVRVAEAAPGIDVVIGGHSHTELTEAIIVNGRTPVVQTGMEGRNLGELVITLDSGKPTVVSYRLYPIDDAIAGDRTVNDEIENLKKTVTAVVFASRGYSIDQRGESVAVGAGPGTIIVGIGVVGDRGADLRNHCVDTRSAAVENDLRPGAEPVVVGAHPVDANRSVPSLSRILSPEHLVPDATPVSSQRLQAPTWHHPPVLN
jgi:5'-nucleotidase / UDP-sugar diphosphatase